MTDDIKGTWEEVIQRNEQADQLLEEWKREDVANELVTERQIKIENILASMGYVVDWQNNEWVLGELT